jgi:hypothetical protein
LNTDNIVSVQKGLKMRDDFVVAGSETTREGEATRVDVGGDNGGKLEHRARRGGGNGRGSLRAIIMF